MDCQDEVTPELLAAVLRSFGADEVHRLLPTVCRMIALAKTSGEEKAQGEGACLGPKVANCDGEHGLELERCCASLIKCFQYRLREDLVEMVEEWIKMETKVQKKKDDDDIDDYNANDSDNSGDSKAISLPEVASIWKKEIVSVFPKIEDTAQLNQAMQVLLDAVENKVIEFEFVSSILETTVATTTTDDDKTFVFDQAVFERLIKIIDPGTFISLCTMVPDKFDTTTFKLLVDSHRETDNFEAFLLDTFSSCSKNEEIIRYVLELPETWNLLKTGLHLSIDTIRHKQAVHILQFVNQYNKDKYLKFVEQQLGILQEMATKSLKSNWKKQIVSKIWKVDEKNRWACAVLIQQLITHPNPDFQSFVKKELVVNHHTSFASYCTSDMMAKDVLVASFVDIELEKPILNFLQAWKLENDPEELGQTVVAIFERCMEAYFRSQATIPIGTSILELLEKVAPSIHIIGNKELRAACSCIEEFHNYERNDRFNEFMLQKATERIMRFVFKIGLCKSEAICTSDLGSLLKYAKHDDDTNYSECESLVQEQCQFDFEVANQAYVLLVLSKNEQAIRQVLLSWCRKWSVSAANDLKMSCKLLQFLVKVLDVAQSANAELHCCLLKTLKSWIKTQSINNEIVGWVKKNANNMCDNEGTDGDLHLITIANLMTQLDSFSRDESKFVQLMDHLFECYIGNKLVNLFVCNSMIPLLGIERLKQLIDRVLEEMKENCPTLDSFCTLASCLKRTQYRHDEIGQSGWQYIMNKDGSKDRRMEYFAIELFKENFELMRQVAEQDATENEAFFFAMFSFVAGSCSSSSSSSSAPSSEVTDARLNQTLKMLWEKYPSRCSRYLFSVYLNENKHMIHLWVPTISNALKNESECVRYAASIFIENLEPEYTQNFIGEMVKEILPQCEMVGSHEKQTVAMKGISILTKIAKTLDHSQLLALYDSCLGSNLEHVYGNLAMRWYLELAVLNLATNFPSVIIPKLLDSIKGLDMGSELEMTVLLIVGVLVKLSLEEKEEFGDLEPYFADAVAIFLPYLCSSSVQAREVVHYILYLCLNEASSKENKELLSNDELLQGVLESLMTNKNHRTSRPRIKKKLEAYHPSNCSSLVFFRGDLEEQGKDANLKHFKLEAFHHLFAKVDPESLRRETQDLFMPSQRQGNPVPIPLDLSPGRQSNRGIVLGSLVSKAPNAAGLFKTCDVLGMESLVLSEIKFSNFNLYNEMVDSADQWMPSEQVVYSRIPDYIQEKKSMGYHIVALEQSSESVCITKYKFPTHGKVVFLLGAEKQGTPAHLLRLVDGCIEIPQLGVTRSLNVHASCAILLWEYLRQQQG